MGQKYNLLGIVNEKAHFRGAIDKHLKTIRTMKRILVQVVGLCLVAQLATAQIRLPQPSPGATIVQSVGVTDFTVKYSRPSLRGREIFGNQTPLAPLGQLWRTGANAATTFQTSTDVMVQGQKLAAGTYSVFSIPASDDWTLIFNKNTGASTDAYKQEEDALRVKVRPGSTGERTETFTITFSDLTDSTARLNLLWANTKVSADLRTDVRALSQANVERTVAEKPEDAAVLMQAASWNLTSGRNLDQALAWIDKSIGLKENFRNTWTKAQILAKMNKPAEALRFAQRATELGPNDPTYRFFKDAVEKSVTDYKALVPAATAVKGKKKK